VLAVSHRLLDTLFDCFYNFIADKIYPSQNGFVKGRSIVTQFLDAVHLMVRTIDGEQTDVAFLDFSSSISRTPD